MKDELKMCEDYARTLAQLTELVRSVCYTDKYTQNDVDKLSSLGDRSLLVDVYLDVFLPNLHIITPLTTGQECEFVGADEQDVLLLKSYVSVVDNCEMLLQAIGAKGVKDEQSTLLFS